MDACRAGARVVLAERTSTSLQVHQCSAPGRTWAKHVSTEHLHPCPDQGLERSVPNPRADTHAATLRPAEAHWCSRDFEKWYSFRWERYSFPTRELAVRMPQTDQFPPGFVYFNADRYRSGYRIHDHMDMCLGPRVVFRDIDDIRGSISGAGPSSARSLRSATFVDSL
jgi:hypothetical protein